MRSVAYALELAREVRRSTTALRDIEIVLAPGMHRIDRPIRLGPEDSGTPGRPLVIRGSAEGTSVIDGSIAIQPEPGGVRGYERLGGVARSKARLYRLPERLAGVRQIDTARPKSVAILVERFTPTTTPSVPFEVFDAAGAMVPARWPNNGWGKVEGPAGDGWWGFTTDAPRLDAWRGEPDMWAAGYWKWDYTYERHRVKDVGPRMLSLTTPFTFGLKKDARFHIYHALAELDVAGEWYRDHARNVLIAWPRGTAGKIEVSIAESAIVSEGASHVRIRDLTIEKFFGDAVRVAGGGDVVIEASTIRWAGLHGASFVGARDSGIADSDISDTGEGGVLLLGGDRPTLSPARLFVRSCRIVRFSRIGLTFKPAIDMHGVGNIAAGNFIAEAPNIGIQFQGNDHLIEGNEITDVVNDTTDSGALYTSHDWTARGTIVRNNFIHDLKGRRDGFETKGVYIDDFTSGVTVRGNLFLRVEQPVFLSGGRDNLIEGNVFIGSEPALFLDARGLQWAAASVTDPGSDLRLRLAAMPYRSELWRARYPQLFDLLNDEPGVAKRNVSRGNAVVDGRAYRLEVMAEARHQTLGPDFGAGTVARPVRGQAVEAAKRAMSAAELGRLIAEELRAAGVPDVPFAAMDRAVLAGRYPRQK